MFATLLESGTTVRRRPGTVSMSAVLHLALVAGAVVLSPRRPIEKPSIDLPGRVVFVDRPVPTHNVHVVKGTSGTLPSNGPRFQLPNLTGIDIAPTVATDTAWLDASGDSGVGDGSLPGDRVSNGDAIYSAAVVEKPALALPGNRPPAYPDFLRKAGIEGSVLVQFVIDTTGAPEPQSVRILKSDHQLFSDAVRTVLDRHRFLPAEVGGRRVRMLVQQRFEFAVE